MRVISYEDRRGQAPRVRSVENNSEGFRQCGKRKADRRDKDLANSRVMNRLSQHNLSGMYLTWAAHSSPLRLALQRSQHHYKEKLVAKKTFLSHDQRFMTTSLGYCGIVYHVRKYVLDLCSVQNEPRLRSLVSTRPFGGPFSFVDHVGDYYHVGLLHRY